MAEGSNDKQGTYLEGFRTGSSDGCSSKADRSIKGLCEGRRSTCRHWCWWRRVEDQQVGRS